MIRFERILCPTDFSEFSSRAADYAVALASHYGGEVHFLHVIPSTLLHPSLYPYAIETLSPPSDLKEKALERLVAFAAHARAMGVHTRVDVVEGDTVSTILDAASEDAAQLICLGTYGRTGFERLALGSITEKVLRKAPCPVLTVREPGEKGAIRYGLFKNILCAVDFAPSHECVEYALSLAEEAEGHLTLAHVVEYPMNEPELDNPYASPDVRARIEEGARRRLDELVPSDAAERCETETLVRSGKPYLGLLSAAWDRKADLIVIGKHGRAPLDRMLYGSTTNHVVRDASCPVLMVVQESHAAGNGRRG